MCAGKKRIIICVGKNTFTFDTRKMLDGTKWIAGVINEHVCVGKCTIIDSNFGVRAQ